MYWANPSNTPYAVPLGWTSTGPNSGALWGNDGPVPYRLRLSDVLPDGRAAVDFGTTTGATVSQPPTFNPNGTVTFFSTPAFATPAGRSLRRGRPQWVTSGPACQVEPALAWLGGRGYILGAGGPLPDRTRRKPGDVAQLGERRVRNAKVEGSSPFVSIIPAVVSGALPLTLTPVTTVRDNPAFLGDLSAVAPGVLEKPAVGTSVGTSEST